MAFVYKSGDEPEERQIQVVNQRVTDTELAGAIVSVFTTSSADGIYQVQQITIDESGIVSVTAVVVPSQADQSSKVAYYTLTPSEFDVEK